MKGSVTASSMLWVTMMTFTLLLMTQNAEGLSCKNSNGDNVAWWFIYTNTGDLTGPLLWYFDSEDRTEDDSLTDATGAFKRTVQENFPLDEVAGDDIGVRWLMYNEQPGTGSPGNNVAHSKGMLAYDATSLVSIVHTVPQVPLWSPDAFSTYDLDTLFGRNLGAKKQNSMCITDGGDVFQLYINTLVVANVHILKSNYLRPGTAQIGIASKATGNIPLGYLFNPAMFRDDTFDDDAILPPSKYFRHTGRYYIGGGYGYNGILLNDIWGDFAADTGVHPSCTQFLSFTYHGEKQNLPSNDVLTTVDALGMGVPSPVNIWSRTHDHSKWMISADQPGCRIVCVGGQNRYMTNVQRGANFACIYGSQGLWERVSGMIRRTASRPDKDGDVVATFPAGMNAAARTAWFGSEDDAAALSELYWLNPLYNTLQADGDKFLDRANGGRKERAKETSRTHKDKRARQEAAEEAYSESDNDSDSGSERKGKGKKKAKKEKKSKSRSSDSESGGDD